MNEQKKTLVIDVRLTRGLVATLIVVLLAVACAGYLALGQQSVSAGPADASAAAAAGSSGLRQYYLTDNTYDGAAADTACAAGYHMASLWEILDTSNLEYSIDLGRTEGDSGAGPVSGYNGWVRTGYNNRGAASDPAGQANCNGWSSNSPSAYGTVVNLVMDWTQTADVGVWQAFVVQCDSGGVGVWCVED